jgi:SnoaL-like polyketide cyclase
MKALVIAVLFANVFGSMALAKGSDPYDSPIVEYAKKRIIQERIKASNEKDFKKWESFHAKEACRTAPELPGELCGSENMRVAIEELVVSFPDYHLELVESFGAGLKYMAKIRARGTFLKAIDIGGGQIVPPTGKMFTQEWIANITFNKEGKIIRFEEFHDQLDIYKQLGVLD